MRISILCHEFAFDEDIFKFFGLNVLCTYIVYLYNLAVPAK